MKQYVIICTIKTLEIEAETKNDATLAIDVNNFNIHTNIPTPTSPSQSYQIITEIKKMK